MKERMSQLKENDMDSNHRMTQISDEWNKLTEEVKADWKEKAKAIADVAEPSKLQIKLKEREEGTQTQ